MYCVYVITGLAELMDCVSHLEVVITFTLDFKASHIRSGHCNYRH